MKFQGSTLLSVAALCFSLCVVSASRRAAVGAPVNTTSGLIVGHADPSYPGVSEYLGIPFARPPTADLRFAPPQSYSGSKRIVADKQPSSCPQNPSIRNASAPQPEQNIDASHASFSNHTSEDCLYLNIWSKVLDSCEEKKPVVVWFYGGGFHSGGIFADEQDVVMVNPNYRLGIFGFSGAPGLTQNVGLLDQRLALEWVRDNIGAFGGDAARITIMGHSAGGASVDFYTYAWLDDPIIAGAIPMSGTATSFGRRAPSTGVAAWDATSQLLGCGNSSTTASSAMLSCMRQKGKQDLFEASLKAEDQVAKTLSKEDRLYVGITGLYSPTVDNKTVFTNYTTLASQGRFVKVPIMTGTNIDEACLSSQRGQTPVKEDRLITEVAFACPVHHAATFRASAGIPAWQYLWFGGYSNQNFPVCSGKPWHGSEVSVMFGSTVIASQGENATTKEVSDGLYMRQSVAAFAHNPSDGLQAEMHWPKFNSDENHVIELATNQTKFVDGNKAAADKLCDTIFRNDGPIY